MELKSKGSGAKCGGGMVVGAAVVMNATSRGMRVRVEVWC